MENNFYIVIEYADSDFFQEFYKLAEYFCKKWNDHITYYNYSASTIISDTNKLEKTFVNALIGFYIVVNSDYVKQIIDNDYFVKIKKICESRIIGNVKILDTNEFNEKIDKLEYLENLVIEFANNKFSYIIL